MPRLLQRISRDFGQQAGKLALGTTQEVASVFIHGWAFSLEPPAAR